MKIRDIFIGLVLLALSGCDDEGTQFLTVSFPSDRASISEDSPTPLTVTLKMNKKSKKQRFLFIEMSTTTADLYESSFTSDKNFEPSSNSITAIFPPNTTVYEFDIIPIDNNEQDGDKFLSLSLNFSNPEVKRGKYDTILITIEDDDV